MSDRAATAGSVLIGLARVLRGEGVDLSSAERITLLALASYANAEGVSWPELSTLARWTGLGRSSVKRSLSTLEASGWVRRTRRTLGGSAAPTSTLYQLDLGRIGGGSTTGLGRPTVDLGGATLDLPGGSTTDRRRATVGPEDHSEDHSLLKITGKGSARLAPPGPKGKSRKAPKAEKATPAHVRYAEAYAKGIATASGHPFAAPRGKSDLVAMATTHAKGDDGKPLVGDALVAWFEATAAAYHRATCAKPQFQAGYSAQKCLAWLQAGRPVERANGKVNVQPAAPGGQEAWEVAYA